MIKKCQDMIKIGFDGKLLAMPSTKETPAFACEEQEEPPQGPPGQGALSETNIACDVARSLRYL